MLNCVDTTSVPALPVSQSRNSRKLTDGGPVPLARPAGGAVSPPPRPTSGFTSLSVLAALTLFSSTPVSRRSCSFTRLVTSRSTMTA